MFITTIDDNEWIIVKIDSSSENFDLDQLFWNPRSYPNRAECQTAANILNGDY